MSTFEQDADGQERHDADGVTVRDSSASTHNYVGASNFESARANRRNRKPTAAFGGTERRPGEPDQGQDIYLIDPIDDNNQDKLFVTSMMVDPEDKREGAANAKQALCKSRNKPSLQSGYNPKPQNKEKKSKFKYIFLIFFSYINETKEDIANGPPQHPNKI